MPPLIPEDHGQYPSQNAEHLHFHRRNSHSFKGNARITFVKVEEAIKVLDEAGGMPINRKVQDCSKTNRMAGIQTISKWNKTSRKGTRHNQQIEAKEFSRLKFFLGSDKPNEPQSCSITTTSEKRKRVDVGRRKSRSYRENLTSNKRNNREQIFQKRLSSQNILGR